MKQAQLMIATQNNVGNLMPMLMEEFGSCTAVILASEYASKQRWSANLKYVLKKKGKPVEIWDWNEEDTDNLTQALKSFDKVYFNISGGKKSQILQLLKMYQYRNKPEDSLIYLDSNPFRLLQIKDYDVEERYRPKYLLDLEDILNLHGYTCISHTQKSSCKALDIKEMEIPQERIRKINNLFLSHEVFAKLMYSYFDRMAIKEDEKQSDRDRIISLLKKNRPSFGEASKLLDPKLHSEFEEVSKAIKSLKSAIKGKGSITADDLQSLWNSLKTIPHVNDTYNRFWGSMRDAMVSVLMKNIKNEDPVLINDKNEIAKILKMCDWLEPDYSVKNQICHSDVPKLLGLEKVPKGSTFEYMFNVLVWDTIKEIGAELVGRLYNNVKAYEFDYDENGDAIPKEQASENLAEFDLVFVMENGTLLVFECKTFGLLGDQVKSKSWSATTHGGIFSQITLSTHVQKQHYELKEDAISLIPNNLRAQLDSIQKYTNNIWFFDSVQEKLKKMIKKE